MDPTPSPWQLWFRARRHRGAALGRLLHRRYSRLFWALHSAWALLSGVAVLVLAHNRYGFLRWAVLFIALTWASTLFFSRFAVDEVSGTMRFAQGLVSYLTRVMYQETLFFLIPFYFYSTTFPSWNSAYVFGLSALAALSCFDMFFDRLLREKPWFSVTFFAIVSFSALQFFFPLVLRVRVDKGAYLAAAISFAAAAALFHRREDLRDRRTVAMLVAGLIVATAAVRLVRPLLPPVPLRLTRVRFSGALDVRTLQSKRNFEDEIPLGELRSGRIFAVATVFSPERIPARVQLRWTAEGKSLRSSRTVAVTTRPGGFRIWDSLRADGNGFTPGRYRLDVRTAEGQLIGRRDVRVVEEE